MDPAGTHWNHRAAAVAWDVVRLLTAATAVFNVLILCAAADVSGQLTSACAANTFSHQNGVRVQTLTSGTWKQA